MYLWQWVPILPSPEGIYYPSSTLFIVIKFNKKEWWKMATFSHTMLKGLITLFKVGMNPTWLNISFGISCSHSTLEFHSPFTPSYTADSTCSIICVFRTTEASALFMLWFAQTDALSWSIQCNSAYVNMFHTDYIPPHSSYTPIIAWIPSCDEYIYSQSTECTLHRANHPVRPVLGIELFSSFWSHLVCKCNDQTKETM